MSITRSPAPREPATDAAAAGWGEAALVLIAHGAQRDRNAARTIDRHAGRLRRRRLFAEVRTCLLRADPSPESVLAGLTAPVVYLMPMLMSDGYILREQIVRRLGLAGPETLQAAPGVSGAARRLILCPPVGEHPGLAAMIDRRVAALCGRLGLPPRETSVLLVAHGTPRHSGSRDAAERCAAALGTAGRYAAVGTAFLNEPPFPEDALRRLPSRRTIAVGLFAAEGLHGGADLPRLLDPPAGPDGPAGVAADAAGTVFYAGAVGVDAGLPDLVLDCVRQGDRAAAHPPACSGSGHRP